MLVNSIEGGDLKCALLDFDKVPDLAGKSKHLAVAEGEAEDLRGLLHLNHLLPGVGDQLALDQQLEQLLQAGGVEGQGEDNVLAIELVQGPEETPEEGRLEGEEDRVDRQGGQGVGGEEQQVGRVVELPVFEEPGTFKIKAE